MEKKLDDVHFWAGMRIKGDIKGFEKRDDEMHQWANKKHFNIRQWSQKLKC